MKAILIETVEGLTKATGATAGTLVWENRVVIDSKCGTKHPLWRRFVLWHEWKHCIVAQKHGMTRAAFLRNWLWDLTYVPTALPPFAYWYFHVWRKDPRSGKGARGARSESEIRSP